MIQKSRTGVLLINLGTPSSPNKKNVRSYLREFLSDQRVIDLPAPWRQLLVNLLILPFRTKNSAHAYQQIWQPEGSPLLIHSKRLVSELAQTLGEDFEVVLGMRYGLPSLTEALTTLYFKKCKKIIILPLFPQYSSAATGSALEKALALIQKMTDIPNISICQSFYQNEGFIEAWSEVIKANLPQNPPDKWVFTYHGLPLRHLKKIGCNPVCLNPLECSVATKNERCYRQQCYQTTKLLADALNLNLHQYEVAFQSRLGRTPWITPYADQLFTSLAQQGIKRIAVVCPSFVSDCLETLEEMGIRARKQWIELGGTEFHLFPSLNVHSTWIKALSQMILKMI
ncbi:MAG: ferrochelatase [Proteobacteria bacterium]|nr:ferrochelatase [Pseudomonadota bacterium]